MARPNILLFVPDDIGLDQVGLYNVDVNNLEPPTPNFDALCQNGVRFLRAHSYPFCSPTRVCFLTGRYGFRTGVGQLVRGDTRPVLQAEVLLPRAIRRGTDDAYRMGAFGKWHIANYMNDDVRHPTACGFDEFSGTMRNIQDSQNYFSWEKVRSYRSRSGGEGLLTRETCHEYALTSIVDDAIKFIQDSGTSPFFCYVPVHSPHEPWHRPPAHLYDTSLYSLPHEVPNFAGVGESRVPYFKAMVQAMDREFGRLLASMTKEVRDNTIVIYFSDNGTSELIVQPPLDPLHAKLSVYQLGTNVPMAVSGRGVSDPGRTSNVLVDAVDLFSTVLDLMGVDQTTVQAITPLDGLSFKGVLDGTNLSGLRTTSYSELFAPNMPNTISGVGGLNAGQRAMRFGTVKLLRRNNGAIPLEEFYDLAIDPQETNDLLLAPLVPPYAGLYAGISAAMDALLA